ncbi:MAG: putative transport system ATP-binding protein [Solirubrobacteraceae bacterium]|jgi:putative ABC transport system ATP-binding protein/lipoprotein-releasing system ATP-binding protein|nr:putative transport system ATP-binding protein [Solirubrobacteraceae bacterium]
MPDALVRCEGVSRTFGRGVAATVALEPTTCHIAAGDRIALMGRSGSGKSTLLHLMAGLDTPTAGTLTWPTIGDPRSPGARGRVAVVFQGPSLLAPLTVLENAALPLILAGATDAVARERARDALAQLALEELADKLPEEISGGQAQRAAIARALAGEPLLILADEPTGQLDRDNAEIVITLLLEAAQHAGAGLLVTTHDPAVAAHLPTRWEMHSGRLSHPVASCSS